MMAGSIGPHQGLYLWVYEDGRKYWRLRYKIHGKEKSLSLGVYPVVGLKQARQLAQAERVKLASNIDPSHDRQINKQKSKEAAANSFEAVAREWYGNQAHGWVKNHSKDVLRRLEVNVFPYIGRYPISIIEAPQLLNIIRIIEQRGSYDLAHRVLGVPMSENRIVQGRLFNNPGWKFFNADLPKIPVSFVRRLTDKPRKIGFARACSFISNRNFHLAANN